MIYIVDTFAWIEYLEGNPKGKELKKLIESKNKLITMECCISELKGYCLKNNENFHDVMDVIKNNSVILPVLRADWIKAAEIKFELRKKIQHFGLIDALLVAKQQEHKCSLITGDPHFKTLKNITYIGD